MFLFLFPYFFVEKNFCNCCSYSCLNVLPSIFRRRFSCQFHSSFSMFLSRSLIKRQTLQVRVDQTYNYADWSKSQLFMKFSTGVKEASGDPWSDKELFQLLFSMFTRVYILFFSSVLNKRIRFMSLWNYFSAFSARLRHNMHLLN